jgi:hypothetical protein
MTCRNEYGMWYVIEGVALRFVVVESIPVLSTIETN